MSIPHGAIQDPGEAVQEVEVNPVNAEDVPVDGDAAEGEVPAAGDPVAPPGEAAADEANWNPIEWDRAAEDLTWERLLGLDGSLVCSLIVSDISLAVSVYFILTFILL